MATFLLRDVRVFTGEEVFEQGYVHVEDGKIQSFGPTSSIPELSIKTQSRPGHTVLPGLIDCHIHADMADPEALSQALRFGVTTVCDMQNELENVLKLKKQTLEADTASYKTAGQAATVDNGWPIPVILAHNKSEEVLNAIAKWPKLTDRKSVIDYLDWTMETMQPDYIKLMHESGAVMGGQTLNKPTVELQRTIIEEAHGRGLLVVAHALSLQDTVEVLEAGVDGLTHTVCDAEISPELVEAYKKNNVWINPTLTAIGSLTTEGQALQERFAHDPRVHGLIAQERIANMCKCMSFSVNHAKVAYAYEGIKTLFAAGLDIVCGSDSAGPAVGTAFGLTMHQELHLFVHEIGMTPQEALRSATSLTARRFKFHDRGRISHGLNADLLLVEGNPLEDIDATLNIRGVWREGKVCSTYANTLEPGTP